MTLAGRHIAPMLASRGTLRAARSAAKLIGAVVVAISIGQGNAFAAEEVTITVTGNIVASCAISGMASSANLGNISQAGSLTVPFTIDCNAPFAYALKSVNGGLKHQAVASAPSGFSVLLPYAVQTVIATNSGAGINQACTSTNVKDGAVTCPFVNSGNAVAINQPASLGISWAASGQPLLAGSYQDVLTLTVSTPP